MLEDAHERWISAQQFLLSPAPPPLTRDQRPCQTNGRRPRKNSSRRKVLDKTVIAIPLLDILDEEEKKKKRGGKPEPQLVIIDINLEYREGPAAARERIKAEIARAIKEYGSKSKRIEQGVNEAKSELSEQYLFARLEVPVIRGLVRIDNEERKASDEPGARLRQRAIYRIWPDFPINALINRSLATVKADAARTSFSASGQDIVWAVLDSGIDEHHPHFATHGTLKIDSALSHRDFTVATGKGDPLKDEFGHGTHVAGIIAGEIPQGSANHVVALARHRDEHGTITFDQLKLDTISGMAPQVQAAQPEGARRGRTGHREQPHRRHRDDSEDQRKRAPPAGSRRQHERRLRLRARVVRLRPEPVVRRGQSPRAERSRRGRGGGQHRLRLRAVRVSRHGGGRAWA